MAVSERRSQSSRAARGRTWTSSPSLDLGPLAISDTHCSPLRRGFLPPSPRLQGPLSSHTACRVISMEQDC